MFSHEKLTVYQDCLALIADAGRLVAEFDGKHSFATHLPEAAESSAINLVEACREVSLAQRRGCGTGIRSPRYSCGKTDFGWDCPNERQNGGTCLS